MTADAAAARSDAGRAYLYLTLTTLMWAGNTIAGRLAVGEVSPMVVTSLRWFIVSLIVGFIARDRIIADWPVLRPRLGLIVAMGVFGYTGFNALFYLAAHYTGAVNLAILQGGMPVVIFLVAFAVYGTPIRLGQAAGIVLTFAGIAMVAAKGHLGTLAALDINVGDLLLLAACVLYGGYTVALRNRPRTSDLGFFAIMAVAAFLISLPLVVLEWWAGTMQWPTPYGWAVTLWIAIFPSLLAQLFYMRGVALIGPGRAGIFANLVPIFGAAMAVGLLGEPFGWFHAVGLVMVIGGIVWAQRT